MTVITRTNRATRPAAVDTTSYSSLAGTGGAVTFANINGTGYTGIGFNRVTWTTGTTAVSGGVIYVQDTGLSAATQYTHQVWVRSSKTQTLRLTSQYRNASNVNVGAVTASPTITATANNWVQLVVTSTSGAAVNDVVLLVEATTGGSNWATGNMLDIGAVCIETGNTAGPYFDGSFTNAGSVMYAWAGVANASASTAVTYIPQLILVQKSDAPCPRVEITITDLVPTTSIVNVWRTADGKRQAVRSARGRTLLGSDFITDYEAPLGRVVAYDLEILTGSSAQAVVNQQTITVNSASWWIQDPLVPSSAIPVNVTKQDSSAPYLTAAAVKSLEYSAAVSIIPIMGSPEPVALMGNRTLPAGVDFSMFTNTAQVTTTLRNLIQQTPLLLVRPNGIRNNGIPGLAYYASAKPIEHPVTVAFGGTLTNWQLTGDLVAAPTMNVLIPIWTYGSVQALWDTYQQAQTTLAAKTYLGVLKSPTGV